MKHSLIRPLVFLLLIFCLLPAIPVLGKEKLQDATGNISEEAFWALVKESLQAVRESESLSKEAAALSLETYSKQWDAITTITLADGTSIPASGNYIASVLRQADTAKAIGALEALLTARGQPKQTEHSASDIEMLQSILARSEFQWQEKQPNPIQEFFDKLRQWFFDLLEKLLPNDSVNVDTSLFRYIFDALAGILFVLVLFFILRYVYTGFITETASQPGEPGEADNLTAQTAMERAQTFSGTGDYRTAVRYLYLSALLLLDERGLLRYDRTKTNREYLRSIASYPELATPLGAVIDVFDRVWYGFEGLDEQSYAQYRAHVESLKEQK